MQKLRGSGDKKKEESQVKPKPGRLKLKNTNTNTNTNKIPVVFFLCVRGSPGLDNSIILVGDDIMV